VKIQSQQAEKASDERIALSNPAGWYPMRMINRKHQACKSDDPCFANESAVKRDGYRNRREVPQ
jgi:hypothetical protein